MYTPAVTPQIREDAQTTQPMLPRRPVDAKTRFGSSEKNKMVFFPRAMKKKKKKKLQIDESET